jgi:hypothetical protein
MVKRSILFGDGPVGYAREECGDEEGNHSAEGDPDGVSKGDAENAFRVCLNFVARYGDERNIDDESDGRDQSGED